MASRLRLIPNPKHLPANTTTLSVRHRIPKPSSEHGVNCGRTTTSSRGFSDVFLSVILRRRWTGIKGWYELHVTRHCKRQEQSRFFCATSNPEMTRKLPA